MLILTFSCELQRSLSPKHRVPAPPSARPLMAGHKRGRTCWRLTSQHRRCWDICAVGQAGHTSTASQRRSNGRAIAPPRQSDICGRPLMSAMSWPSKAQVRTTSIWRRSASTCASAAVRAPKEAVATTTPFTAPGSFAGTSSRSACAGPRWQRRLPSRIWSPADIGLPWRGYSPAVRAPRRNRRGTVRLARSANVPASSLPGSRSPTRSSPFVTGHRWPTRWGRGSARYGDKESRNSQKNTDIGTPTPHYWICP